MKAGTAILLLLWGITSGCDQGLAPPPRELPTGIRGTVTFLSAWPPPDSVQELRVVAFQRFPLGDSSSIIAEVLAGRAFFSDTLPRFVDSTDYAILLHPPFPDTLRYIAVAWRYGPRLFADWLVAGVYTAEIRDDTLIPGTVRVIPHRILEHIDIAVDFAHLPPQPFE